MALDTTPDRRALAAIALGVVVAVVAAVTAGGPKPAAVHRAQTTTTTIYRTLPPADGGQTTTTTVPTPTTTVPAPPASPPGTYTVQPGDTLAGIAAAHGLDWPGVCYANRLADCNHIYPGQVLQLRSEQPPPGTQPSPPPAAAPGPRAAPAPGATNPAPSNYGCADAAAYVAANAAPGFDLTCAPGAATAPCASLQIQVRVIGCTVGGPGGGHIYIDSTSGACGIRTSAMNEAANSRKLAGLAPNQITDPYDSEHATSPNGNVYGVAHC